MAKGKFSGPRPYREEERQIEQAFRQVTEPGKPSEYTPAFSADPAPGTEPAAPEAVSTDFTPEDALLPGEPEEVPGLYEEETPGSSEPDFLDKLIAFVEGNRKTVLVGACGLVLVLILAFLAIFFLGSGGDPYNSKILSNVMIAGVNVGGLTKSQATQVVKNNVAPLYADQDMTVRLGSTTLTLSAADTKAKLDVKDAVNAAYSYGRTGTKAEKQAAYTASFTQSHTIALLPYLELDTGYIQSVLEQYNSSVDSTLTQPSYALEGTVPELGTDVFDPETAPQLTLVVTMGTPGVDFQGEGLYNAILDAYSLGSFQVSWEDTDADALPETPDMQKVLEEMGKEPVDDSVDLSTFQTIPGSYGYTFDVPQAQAMVNSAQYGQILRIAMTYVAPERMGEEAFYQDTLGKGRTPFSDNADRVSNMQLVCQALNGTVINPGKTFSFNQCVGERTAARGYKSALTYTSAGKTYSYNGGVSQVASTLYYAALTADLEILERHDHGLVVSYIDMGLDAYVAGGNRDLQFQNNTNFPLKLQASAENGAVVVEILGTDDRDYYITLSVTVAGTYDPATKYQDFPADNDKGYKDGTVIQEGVTGYAVKSYKNKYDKTTGTLLSKDFITSTRYLTIDKLVARITDEETTPPTQETEPDETLTPTPTPGGVDKPTDPTEKPTEPTEKPTEPTEKPTDPPTVTQDPTEKPTDPPKPPEPDPPTSPEDEP